jgi:hypothetical protein
MSPLPVLLHRRNLLHIADGAPSGRLPSKSPLLFFLGVLSLLLKENATSPIAKSVTGIVLISPPVPMLSVKAPATDCRFFGHAPATRPVALPGYALYEQGL